MGLECMGLDSVSLEPEGLEFMGPIIKPSSNIIKRENSGVESSGLESSGMDNSGKVWKGHSEKKLQTPMVMSIFSYL